MQTRRRSSEGPPVCLGPFLSFPFFSGPHPSFLWQKTKKQPEPPQRAFPLDRATKFIFFLGTEKKEVTRQEAYTDVQFKEGARVAVVSDETGMVLEVRIGSPSKEVEKK